MSPTPLSSPRPPSIQAALDRIWLELGERIRTERRRRGWSIQLLALRVGVSRWSVYLLERGEPSSLDLAVRCLGALGFRLEVDAVDPRKSTQATKRRTEDPVHAAMGELEASTLRAHGFRVAIDEPYQHFQFAGRADVVAWTVKPATLIHLENRTQFPNHQEAAGAFNAKKAYLAGELANRLGVGRFVSVTHVMVCLWSAEVLHSLRIHPETFRALGPDPAAAFERWWSGTTPAVGTSATVAVMDPFASERQRQWIDLEAALDGARPRYRGYAEAAARAGARDV